MIRLLHNGELPYRYHTFLYPFLWDNNGESSMDTVMRALSGRWESDHIADADGRLNRALRRDPAFGKLNEDPQLLEDYRCFQYFNPATRMALFQGPPSGQNGDPIVVCLRLKLSEDWQYVIRFLTEDEKGEVKEEVLRLDVNAIRLKVYNTGVAVMVYELEYHPDKKLTADRVRQNVLRINEYGRRLYPEFIPVPADKGFLLTAEKLEIRRVQDGTDEVVLSDDFRQRCREGFYLENPTYIPDIVRGLLTWGRDGGLSIEPAIDDRMFVCCCIVDGEYPKKFLGYDPWSGFPYDSGRECRQSRPWRFRTDWDTAQELYALLNIDPDRTGSSCQSREDLDRYFDRQLYTRWMEYGTIHGVTNHSMLCVTSPSVRAEVIDPFLTLYTRICILTLVQRASLISFDKKLSELAATDLRSWYDQDRLSDMQQTFTKFQGQLLLSEVTPQIQGIELYRKLQEMLFINELEENIQKQAGNLFEVVEALQGSRLNVGGLCLAVAALALTVWQAREVFSPDYDWPPNQIVEIAIALSIVILVPFLTKRFLKLRHTRKKRSKRN